MCTLWGYEILEQLIQDALALQHGVGWESRRADKSCLWSHTHVVLNPSSTCRTV